MVSLTITKLTNATKTKAFHFTSIHDQPPKMLEQLTTKHNAILAIDQKF